VNVHRPKVVEICAGAGGQSLGLHLAGFEHELAVELDATAAETLRQNLRRLQGGKPNVVVGDVADLDLWTPADFVGTDLLAGGVPCPPFSVAGKQLGSADERDLFAWAVELVGHLQPRAVMLENVRGLMGARFSGYRQAVLDRLRELGYIADWRLLEARDYGVPQLRPRTVLVALRPDDAPFFLWPEKHPTEETVGSSLFDLMARNGWPGAERWAEQANAIAPTIVGGSKRHGGADLGPTRAKAAWRLLGVDAMGVADTAPDSDFPINGLPRLTNEMVARIQGWMGPEYEWEFVGRKTSVYRQIGNAFPPPVARAVGEAILDALQHRGTAQALPVRIVEHDPVYALLRSRKTAVSADTIADKLGGKWTTHQVVDHLERLSHDFELIVRRGKNGPTYRLGEFHAFRGQGDHVRHSAFAARRGLVS
jgi:DNA (cytosine-5)-methyltransferase 1